MNIKNGQLKMVKSSWGTQQEVYLNPKQLSDMYQVSWETVIGYIYESEESKLDTYHCIDCTKKKYPAGYNKLGTLTDDYIILTRKFSSKQMKDIFCGTCSKIIATVHGNK